MRQFWSDLLNLLTWRPVKREPKPPPCSCRWGQYGWRIDDTNCPRHGAP